MGHFKKIEHFYNSCKSGAIYSLLAILKYSNVLPECMSKKSYTAVTYTRKTHFFIAI